MHKAELLKSILSSIEAKSLFEMDDPLRDELLRLLLSQPTNLEETRARWRDLGRILARITGTPSKVLASGLYPEVVAAGAWLGGDDYVWTCSAVMIHKRIALTAAHADQFPDEVVDRVAVGINRISQVKSNAGSIRVVRDKAPLLRADVLVLLLDETVGSTATPASTADIIPCGEVDLVGFGIDPLTRFTVSDKAIVESIGITSIWVDPSGPRPTDEAAKDYRACFEFCAGGTARDACPGDSGAPAFVRTLAGPRLAGIASRPAAGSGLSCLCGQGTVYARTDVLWPEIQGIANGWGVAL